MYWFMPVSEINGKAIWEKKLLENDHFCGHFSMKCNFEFSRGSCVADCKKKYCLSKILARFIHLIHMNSKCHIHIFFSHYASSSIKNIPTLPWRICCFHSPRLPPQYPNPLLILGLVHTFVYKFWLFKLPLPLNI